MAVIYCYRVLYVCGEWWFDKAMTTIALTEEFFLVQLRECGMGYVRSGVVLKYDRNLDVGVWL